MQPAVNIAPLFRDPVFVLLFFWVATALGYRFSRLIGKPLVGLSRVERGVVCAALGAGFLQYVPFVLGLFGMATVPALRVAAVGIALALVATRDLLRVARAGWAVISEF